jgi:hypothetical protein
MVETPGMDMTDLAGLDLSDVVWPGADLRRANLAGASLTGEEDSSRHLMADDARAWLVERTRM